MSSKNSNCLEGIECPRCGSQGPFRIACTSIADVEDDGTGDHESIEWNDHSYCECKHCHAFGIVLHFRTENRGKLDIPAKATSFTYSTKSVLDLSKCARNHAKRLSLESKGGRRG